MARLRGLSALTFLAAPSLRSLRSARPSADSSSCSLRPFTVFLRSVLVTVTLTAAAPPGATAAGAVTLTLTLGAAPLAALTSAATTANASPSTNGRVLFIAYPTADPAENLQDLYPWSAG